MSSIHQPHLAQGKTLAQQLKQTLGLHRVQLGLASGGTLEGVVGELGEDYCLLMEPFEQERWVSLRAIEWVKPLKA